MTSQLELRNVSVNYGSLVAARDFSLTLEAGQIGCLLGPSGCGKTTLLRAIAGFEQLSDGEVHLHGRLIGSRRFSMPPEQRNVGMVFQDFALFPHLNVRHNIAFGLNAMPRRQQRARVDDMLQLVGLADEASRFPHQLSGGQQQRVALARALAPEPDILLLDEPFSSLDSELREQLAHEVRELLKANNVTAILVTHDQQEALAMADQIALLKDGKLVQSDTPFNLYHYPNCEFAAAFIGQGAIISVLVGEHGNLEYGLGPTPNDVGVRRPGERIKLLVRPEDVIYTPDSKLRLEVAGRFFRGAQYLYELLLPDGQRIQCLSPSHVAMAIGEAMPVRFEQRHLVIFEQ